MSGVRPSEAADPCKLPNSCSVLLHVRPAHVSPDQVAALQVRPAHEVPPQAPPVHTLVFQVPPFQAVPVAQTFVHVDGAQFAPCSSPHMCLAPLARLTADKRTPCQRTIPSPPETLDSSIAEATRKEAEEFFTRPGCAY